MTGGKISFGFNGGESVDDVVVGRLEAGVLNVGGGDLEAIEEEGGLAVVNGGGQDAAKDPLQGALDGVGVFQEEEIGWNGDGLLAFGY